MPVLERPRVEYRTPDDLVRDVLRGSVRIPQFQRGFKWEAGDIVKLFDSILRGFPIGNLLLWRRPAPQQTLHIGPLTVQAPQTDSALWVVDGQQRITSLVGALTEAHRSTDTRFRVHLDLDGGEFHTAGPRQQTPRPWLPVSMLMDTATLLRWMRDNSGWLSDEQLALADQAAKAVREYQIPTYVVATEDETPLLEIFTRMNTMGKRLTKSEVFQALHSNAAGAEAADLASLGRVSADMNFGAMDDRLMLRSVLSFRGGDIFREDFVHEFASPDDQADTFRDVAAALREAVEFLRGAGIPHARLLPYSHVVPILVRFVHLHGGPEGRAATLLRRWVWRGAVAGTRSGGISVVDVRSQVAAVDTRDPVGAAVALLSQVRQFRDFAPELDKLHFRHAMAKINVLGLLSAEPQDLTTGVVIDIAGLLGDGSPAQPILARPPAPDTLANRVLLPSGSPRPLAHSLASVAPDIAESHVVDAGSQALLAAGDDDGFLARRSVAVAEVVRKHVAHMAEWGARDGRAIADMIRSVA